MKNDASVTVAIGLAVVTLVLFFVSTWMYAVIFPDQAYRGETVLPAKLAKKIVHFEPVAIDVLGSELDSDRERALWRGVVASADALGAHARTHDGSFAGFDENALRERSAATNDCGSTATADIAPDGGSFVVYQPLCERENRSVCIENAPVGSVPQAYVAETDHVISLYHCQ
jgi:hypothetical protein